MGALPAWKSIGREALVHEAECADHLGIGEFAIEAGELRGQNQTLVNNRATRKRRNVKRGRIFDVGVAYFVLRALAHEIKLALECVFVEIGRASYKNLLDVWLRSPRHAADCGCEAGHVTPAE